MDVGPIVWVASVALAGYFLIKAVQIIKSGRRVSWNEEAQTVSRDILRCIDQGQRHQAVLLLRRLKFIVETKRIAVPGTDLEVLQTLIDGIRIPSRPTDTQRPKEEPSPVQADDLLMDTDAVDSTTPPAALKNDLKLMRERLRKSKHLLLDLRAELLDIESVITRLLKDLEG